MMQDRPIQVKRFDKYATFITRTLAIHHYHFSCIYLHMRVLKCFRVVFESMMNDTYIECFAVLYLNLWV